MARPIFSTDDAQADKHKMERFLHAGRPSVASVIAPISYGPLPLLAFQIQPHGPPRLAATGAHSDLDRGGGADQGQFLNSSARIVMCLAFRRDTASRAMPTVLACV